MALLHAATISPSKAEAIAGWLPSQPWATADHGPDPAGPDPAGDDPAGDVELVAAFRFDDPEGEVGIETHLVRYAGSVLQVPLTYRAAPLDQAAAGALVATMEHSVLGRRWVYDGCADPVYVQLLAALTLTGVGQAASLGTVDGRQVLRAPTVVLTGGGWTGDRLPVDGFGPPRQDGSWTVLSSPELELRLAREPGADIDTDTSADARTPPTLRGTWGGRSEPVTLAVAALLG